MAFHLAVATSQTLPDLSPGDAGLLAALRAEGVEPVVVPWDARLDWRGFDGVLLRTTWDYSDRVEEFRSWLDDLEAAGVPVWNPLPVLRWNLHKDYLRVMGLRGLPVVPTVWIRKGEHLDLDKAMGRQGWGDVVLKPAVSAGGRRTYRIRTGEPMPALPAVAAEDLLLQPFIPEMVERGEVSLVFFAGTFSHAVRKRPAPGDFRVQPQHGGTAVPWAPAPEDLPAASRILQAAPAGWLYARVDLVETRSGPLLMELEMLEPNLFLPQGPGAAEHFAKVIRTALAASPGKARAAAVAGRPSGPPSA